MANGQADLSIIVENSRVFVLTHTYAQVPALGIIMSICYVSFLILFEIRSIHANHQPHCALRVPLIFLLLDSLPMLIQFE
jgi:hypothetical protein